MRATLWAVVFASACSRSGLLSEPGADSGLTIPDRSAPASADAALNDATTGTPDVVTAEAGPCRRDAGSHGSAPVWLFDECLWEAVPALKVCDVYQARLPDPGYPARGWTSCGTGCRVMTPNIIAPYVERSSGYFRMERAWSDDVGTYVKIEIGASGLPNIREIAMLDPFRVLAAFQTRNSLDARGYADCANFDVASGFGPVVMETWEHNVGGDDFHSFYYFARSRYRETPELEPIPLAYDRGSGYGTPIGGFAFTATHWSYWMLGRGLFFTDDWTTIPPHDISIPAPNPSLRRSFRDHFYWLEEDLRTVRAWSPAMGVRDLLTRPSDTVIVDAVWNADGLVWLEAKPAAPGLLSELTVWIVTDPGGASPGIPARVIGLPGEQSPGIVASGGYFASVVCSELIVDGRWTRDECPLYVGRLSDAKLWTLAPPPDRFWQTPRSIDGQRLVVGDLDYPDFWAGASIELYLLDVAELDALERIFAAQVVDRDGGD